MISLIATIKDERHVIEPWLRTLFSQSRLPDEIVLVDGGSTDGTWEFLQQTEKENSIVRVFQKPGNISRGRNAAIHETKGGIIVVTDAGCTYDVGWFARLVEPLESEKAQWSATGFGPWFESHDSLMVYLIAASTIPAPHEFGRDWLPSSRSVAFVRNVWQSVGGYPEWIPVCEDIIFDIKIQNTKAPIAYVREPLVKWRPRVTIDAYLKQLYRYTKSDGHGKLFFGRQLVRYGVYGSALVLIAAACVFSTPLTLMLLVLCGAAYMKKFWRRFYFFTKEKSAFFRLAGIIILPAMVAVGDLAKMVGWPAGVYERITKKITFESYCK